MYGGRQAEAALVDDLFYASAHPYTLGLMESLPKLDDGDAPLRPIGGQPPSLIHLPSGCAFHPRCRYADLDGVCVKVVPPLLPLDDQGHQSSCHFARELLAGALEAKR
jgi:oligopeptide/dipeptide ABC transporter ATP-binding protein